MKFRKERVAASRRTRARVCADDRVYCTVQYCTESRQKTSTAIDFHSQLSSCRRQTQHFCACVSLVAQWRFAVNILKDWGHWAACSGFGAFYGATFDYRISPEFESSDSSGGDESDECSSHCFRMPARKSGLKVLSKGGPMPPIHGSQTGYIFVSRVDAIVDPQVSFDLSDRPNPGPGQPGLALLSAGPPVHRLSVAPLMV